VLRTLRQALASLTLANSARCGQTSQEPAGRSPDPSAPAPAPPTLRLIVARCAVSYTGLLGTVPPSAARLLVLKADGSVMVHADSGGYKPQNCNLTTDRHGCVG